MATNEILLFSLTGVGLHTFDGYEEERIGNLGMAYSVWLLNKYGSEWHFGIYISSKVNRRVSISYFDRMLVLMQSTFSIKALWS